MLFISKEVITKNKSLDEFIHNILKERFINEEQITEKDIEVFKIHLKDFIDFLRKTFPDKYLGEILEMLSNFYKLKKVFEWSNNFDMLCAIEFILNKE